ncbi:MAG: hypothetical protein HOC74_02030, partial [Gemmatimonadetes bacterium]|nr:hypothetical protein [Gemmatimonadota bacterium]
MSDNYRSVPLRFDCPSGDDEPILLTQGIPFADGELPVGASVRLVDGGGRVFPTQATALATWAADGEWVKWLLVDGQMEGRPEELRLEHGGDVEPVDPEEAVRVEESGGRIVLDTGRLRLGLRRGDADFLTAVEMRTEEGWRDLLRDRAFLY